MIITLLVLLLVLFAMWRVGQLNPVGTGKLARRINQLELKVAEQGQRMDGIERSIITIAETVAGTNEAVTGIEKGITALRVEVAGDRGLTQRTWEGVSRLEGYFIQRSFDGSTRP